MIFGFHGYTPILMIQVEQAILNLIIYLITSTNFTKEGSFIRSINEKYKENLSIRYSLTFIFYSPCFESVNLRLLSILLIYLLNTD